MPYLLLHVVVTFALDLVHARTRSQRDRAPEQVRRRPVLGGLLHDYHLAA